MLDAKSIFLENGDSLIFEDEAHLRAFLEYMFSPQSPWLPPGRNDGRTTAHRERYCLRYYLAQEADKFAYPITVEKTERPDFVITDCTGRRTGVEHTDAGPEAYQRWLAQNEGASENLLFADGEARDAENRSPIEEAAVEIVAAVKNKMGSINKSGYQQADAYVLMIYLLSNAPLFFPGDVGDILDRLPDLDGVCGEDAPAGGRSFGRALIIVNGRARYWP